MFEQTFKNIADVLWKEASCTTELDYTEVAALDELKRTILNQAFRGGI